MPNDMIDMDPAGAADLDRAHPGARTVCAAGFAYRLDSGRADLFVEETGQAGTARFVATLAAGDAVFGLAAPTVRFVLMPTAEAVLKTVALDDLVRRPEALAAAADAWVSLVAEALRHLPTPAGGREAAFAAAERPISQRLAPGRHDLAAGMLAVPSQDGLLWCRCSTGEVGNDWGRAAGGAAIALPVSRRAPLHAISDSTVDLLSSLALAREGALAAALAAFDAALGRHLQAWRDDERTAFARHVAGVAEADSAALATAMSALVPGKAALAAVPRGIAEPPLPAMMRVVAEAAGHHLPPDFGRGVQAADDATLKVLAAGAGMRAREVRLRTGWWCSAGEAMIGRLEDGTPVALLPARAGWRLVRPDAPGTVVVDEVLAATLAARAHVLYRGFGETGGRPGRALVRFAFGTARREMALVGIVSLLASLLAMATPFLSGLLVQSVIPDGVRGEIVELILALLAVSVGVIGFELVRGLTVLRVESVLGSSVEAALWNRLLRLPPGFFRRYGAGDLAMRADAVNQIRRTIGAATTTALISALFSFVNLLVLFTYGLRAALLALAVCVVQLVILAGTALFDMRLQRRILANGGAMQTLTVQIFQGIAKLRAAAAENRFLARWTRLFALDQALHFRANVVGSSVSAFGAGWNILVMAALIGLVGFGGVKMSLGDYVTFSGLCGQFVSATLSLAGIIPALATVVPLWERAQPILAEPAEDAGGRLQPGRLNGDIEMAHVTFTYPGGQPALRDVSLSIPAGAFVALVGPSGSGKSSLLRLMLGFDRPDNGTVFLDGHDLGELDVGAVRRQLGVVLQHSRIEAGSLYQNIAGTAPLSLAEAFEAASLAGLADDIAAMPMGLHTHVDDSGATLSGGQRQRLLIARAIARRPRIMLLDEATSALDNAAQAHVMATLARLNITRVVAAHRLSTVRDADLIIVLSEGRIVEQGRYETLAAAGGLFADLIRRQMA
ncbi:Alpha-hemolysin translocation ATP-binding protein HlyB [bacterium YEK0313]|nr:Alpha-hemolysin translocation ATP-binding protein HlyB [bacterium YEK0313]